MAETMSVQAVLSAVDKNFTSTMKKATGTTDDLDQGMKKTNTSILDIAKGVGVFKLVDIGVNAVTGSLGNAISRFDTLNQYPKVLQSLGASAEDSDRGIQILSDGIDGLPTKLDDVAATSQQMFLTFRDADKASQSTIALNNALLASGSSGDKAARGTDAYIKMLRLGKVDMDTWQSLQETMGIGLDKVAKEMLGAEASTNDLYKALQSGEKSIDDFNGALVGMSDELGDLARTNTKGIGTSFSNMANAIGKGVANSITALDNLVKSSGLNADGIAGIFDVLKARINKAFTAVNKSIESASPYVEAFIKTVSNLTPLIPPLTVSVTALGASFLTLKILTSVNSWFKVMNSSANQARLAINIFSTATKNGADATKAFEIAQRTTSGAVKASTIIYGAFTGKVNVLKVAQIGLAKAQAFLSTAMGATTVIIGAAVAAIGLFTWAQKKATAESKELKEEQQKMADSLESTTDSYDDTIGKIVAQTKVTSELQKEVADLSGQENKSVEQKELLKQKVEELNGKVVNLGLAYNEEADSLSLSNEQIQKRIELQQKQEMGNAAEERLIELQQKRTEATENLKKAEEAKQEVDNKFITWGNEIKNTEEALTTAKQNRDVIEEKIAQATITRNNGLQASQDELALNQATMVEQQRVNYDLLTDSQKTAFDSMQTQYQGLRETTTNVFEQIEQKQTISLDQMIENLRKNEEAMRAWSDNVKILSERGVNEGIIAQLEKMGPAGAQQAARLVQETSDELGNLTPEGKAKIDEMNTIMSETLKETTNGMVRIVGEGSEPFASEWEKTGKAGMMSLKESFKESDLQKLGSDVNAGVAKGLEGSTQVKTASENMVKGIEDPLDKILPKATASGKEVPNGLSKGILDNIKLPIDAAGKAAKDTLAEHDKVTDTHSPSREMINRGNYLMQGLSKGIQSNKNLPISSMHNIAMEMVQSMQNLPNNMQNLGYNAMIGFNNGLVSAGNSAIATANRIANDVSETMRKALDVHSPSRVMMEIGGFVGEGLAIGMEKSAKMVNAASETLASASMIGTGSSNVGDINGGSGISANLNLNIGGSSWRAFVEDITDTQNSSIRLENGLV